VPTSITHHTTFSVTPEHRCTSLCYTEPEVFKMLLITGFMLLHRPTDTIPINVFVIDYIYNYNAI